MKNTIIYLVILNLASISFAQQIEWTNAPLNPASEYYTLNHYNLNGAVKEANTVLVGEELFNLYFNEDGYLIKKLTSESGGTLRFMHTYQYVSRGVLKSMKVVSLDAQGYTTQTMEYVFSYNSKGLVTSKTDVATNYGVNYTYDAQNRLIISAVFTPEGTSTYSTEYAYNASGQLVSEQKISPGETEVLKFVYQKADDGIFVVKVESYKNDVLKPADGESVIATLVRGQDLDVFHNPQDFTFDSYGHEVYDKELVEVTMDQLKNVRKLMVLGANMEFAVTELTYYSDVTSTVADTKVTNLCLSGNCNEGYGAVKTASSTITGFFSAGQANGFGGEVYDDGSGNYEGNFKNGLRNGFGTYQWPQSKRFYVGQWKDGAFHGYGYFTEDGEVYQAGFYENGNQTLNMLTQEYIEGEFNGDCRGDCQNGFGLYTFSNDDRYMGFFRNGSRHFVGSYSWASNNIYIGEYQNGNRTGHGIEFYATVQSIYKGEFLNDLRNGLGSYYDKSDTLESKGYWQNGAIRSEL